MWYLWFFYGLFLSLCLCSNVYYCFVNLYSVTNVISVLSLFEKYFVFILFVFCIMVNFVKFKVENICNLQKLHIL